MSAGKHTPGPWQAGRPDMATIVEGFDSKYVYAGDKYVAIATGRDVAEWGEVMANAQVIAAAPTMVEALEEIRVRLTPRTGGVKIDRAGVVALCEAALKKAGVIP